VQVRIPVQRINDPHRAGADAGVETLPK
jgi:hypothetical protein